MQRRLIFYEIKNRNERNSVSYTHLSGRRFRLQAHFSCIFRRPAIFSPCWRTKLSSSRKRYLLMPYSSNRKGRFLISAAPPFEIWDRLPQDILRIRPPLPVPAPSIRAPAETSGSIRSPSPYGWERHFRTASIMSLFSFPYLPLSSSLLFR